MKSLLSFIILFTITCTTQFTITSNEPTKLFMGTIEFPENLNNNDLCLYYKGQKLTTEWNKDNLTAEFSFLESQYAQNLHVLICNNISCQTKDDNTVQHLQLHDDTYKCYHLQAIRIHNEESKLTCFSWNITDYVLEQGMIPDNTLIFLFNPSLVEGIQVHTWSNNQTMRLIPTIQIKKNATSNELVRTMTIARLKALDIDSIHTKDTKAKKQTI